MPEHSTRLARRRPVRTSPSRSTAYRIEQQFKGAVVTKLALVDLPGQGLGWAMTDRSASGGLLNSFYAPTGEVKVAVPADGG
jgi:hypothetical protein